jgi:hypothetical protein
LSRRGRTFFDPPTTLTFSSSTNTRGLVWSKAMSKTHTATVEKQQETHKLLHKTHERLDQFELWINAICQRLKIDTDQCSKTPVRDPRAGQMVPRGSPGSPSPTSSLSPRSDFTRTLSKAENMNDRVRSNLVRVYGRNRQLLMEAETIILWAALHWSHFHLSLNFCNWRAKCHGEMLREILATRASLHWRMAQVARAFNTWNYIAATDAISKGSMTSALNRLFNQKITQSFNTWREVAYDLKCSREAMAHALKRLINRSLACAWTTWVWVAAEIKESKRLLSPTRAPLSFPNHQLDPPPLLLVDHLLVLAALETLQLLARRPALKRSRHRAQTRSADSLGERRALRQSLWMSFPTAASWTSSRQRLPGNSCRHRGPAHRAPGSGPLQTS